MRAACFSPRRVILIGASTGGVEALRFLLPRLPDGLPPIAVVQHIPPNFSRLMAERLNEMCPYEVREAVEGDVLRPGLCLVAPGDFYGPQGSRHVRIALTAADERVAAAVERLTWPGL